MQTFEQLVDDALVELGDPRYLAYLAISSTVLRETRAALIATHERGKTLMEPAEDADYMDAVLSEITGEDNRPMLSDQMEAEACARKIVNLATHRIVQAYFAQMPRTDAVTICKALLLIKVYPGAVYIGTPLHLFPGYQTDLHKFIRDWNEAHPDEAQIMAIEEATL